MFKAILIDSKTPGSAAVCDLTEDALPEGEVVVKVDYSTLNYKDALAITGAGPVVREFPMVPGIDFAGQVVSSNSADFKEGDGVILNGWGVGEKHWGGLAQFASVKADWLVKLPSGMSAKDAMSLGTAGYTAMLCVQALENQGLTPESGKILVSGAAGGVGSVAIHLLSKRGYEVTASSGRANDTSYLTGLGATEIIDRAELGDPGKPLQKERWAGAIDVAGSHTLANICASLSYGGAVAACGLAQGMDFPSSVAPFILRGVALIGVDSVYQPRFRREQAWSALAAEMDPEILKTVTTEIGLAEVVGKAEELLDGKVRGRLVVDVNR